ncbi:hypothetical protein [Nitrosococcus wardiae]|uniref:hypothetical protein n=1 Tax=Nitrosococcus wardiae TaxID=1814290 RepID=UPI001F0E0852|nr:hypothetical protein [Nitrosococcus wardiae]
MVKGILMLAFGIGVLVEAFYKVFHPIMPGVEMMGIIGGVALAANLVCFFLLHYVNRLLPITLFHAIMLHDIYIVIQSEGVEWL